MLNHFDWDRRVTETGVIAAKNTKQPDILEWVKETMEFGAYIDSQAVEDYCFDKFRDREEELARAIGMARRLQHSNPQLIEQIQVMERRLDVLTDFLNVMVFC